MIERIKFKRIFKKLHIWKWFIWKRYFYNIHGFWRVLYLTTKTVHLLSCVWKCKIRINSGLRYFTERIPCQFLWIEFIHSFIKGKFSIFSFVDSTNRDDTMRRSQYESRVEYVIGKILILLTYNDLFFKSECVDFKLIKLVSGCKNIQSGLFSIPKIFIRRLENKFLFWVLINKAPHFFHFSF